MRQNGAVIDAIRTSSAPFVRFPDGTEPPLSQAIKAGNLIFTSGQGPLHPETQEIPADFATQTRQVLENLVAVLTAGGSGKGLVVKCTCYLADRAYFSDFNHVYQEFFADCPTLPARTTIVTELVREGVLVEIDGVGVVGGDTPKGL